MRPVFTFFWQSPGLLLLTHSGQRPSLPKTFHTPLALPFVLFSNFWHSKYRKLIYLHRICWGTVVSEFCELPYLWSHWQSQGSSPFEVTMVTAELELWITLLLLLIKLDIYQKEQFLFLIKSKDFALQSVVYKYKVMHFKHSL